MDTSKAEERIARPWEEFEKWIAASNRELQRYINLRDSAIGYDRYSDSQRAIEEITESIRRAEEEMSKLSLSFTLEGSGLINGAGNEVSQQLRELSDSLGVILEEQDYKEWGIAFWRKVKAVYSFDLNELLIQDGDFTIDKINQLIDEGKITDQKVIEAINYYEDLLSQLESAERQKQELLTATMADSIADSIISGFEQGYDSAGEFADTFEELMKNAIFNALKIQALEEPLKEWYRQFAAYSESGDILTDSEISQLETSYNNIIDGARKRFDEMKRLSGLNFDADGITQSGITGGIKGLTEATGDIIAGQFTAMREIGQKQYLTGIEQLDAINQSVAHLAEIAANTRYNKHLEQIKEDIYNMNKKIQSDL